MPIDFRRSRQRLNELLDEVLLVAQGRTRGHGPVDGGSDLLVLAITLRIAVLLDEHQDVVDVDLDLLDQLDLEDDLVVDRLLVRRRVWVRKS